MPFITPTISCVIVGDDLHVSFVSGGVVGARARRGPVLRGFLGLPESEAREAIKAAAPGGRAPQLVVLTCPASWCALRRVQIGVGQWSSARDEVLRSLDRLLPLSAEDAYVGLVSVGDDAGAVVAVRRSLAQAWIDAVERAVGNPVRRLLTPHMVVPGLGFQHEAEAYLSESDTGLAHRVRYGRVEDVGLSVADVPDGPRVLALPTPEAPDNAHEMAVGAAAAEVVSPGLCWPLIGRRSSPARRWIVRAVAAVLAVMIFAAAGSIRDGALRKGAEESRTARAALVDELDRVMRDKEQAERLLALLDEGIAAATADWGSLLPLLADAHSALDSRGFFYRIEIGPGALTVAGESANETALLEGLEGSDRLTSVSFTAPLRPSQADESLRIFAVRAERVHDGGGKR